MRKVYVCLTALAMSAISALSLSAEKMAWATYEPDTNGVQLVKFDAETFTGASDFTTILTMGAKQSLKGGAFVEDKYYAIFYDSSAYSYSWGYYDQEGEWTDIATYTSQDEDKTGYNAIRLINGGLAYDATEQAMYATTKTAIYTIDMATGIPTVWIDNTNYPKTTGEKTMNSYGIAADGQGYLYVLCHYVASNVTEVAIAKINIAQQTISTISISGLLGATVTSSPIGFSRDNDGLFWATGFLQLGKETAKASGLATVNLSDLTITRKGETLPAKNTFNTSLNHVSFVCESEDVDVKPELPEGVEYKLQYINSYGDAMTEGNNSLTKQWVHLYGPDNKLSRKIMYYYTSATEERQATDEDGNPIYDEEGYPVYETVVVSTTKTPQEYYVYGYDENGNNTTITKMQWGTYDGYDQAWGDAKVIRTNTYDDQNRLTSWSDNTYSFNYEYDDNGNLARAYRAYTHESLYHIGQHDVDSIFSEYDALGRPGKVEIRTKSNTTTDYSSANDPRLSFGTYTYEDQPNGYYTKTLILQKQVDATLDDMVDGVENGKGVYGNGTPGDNIQKEVWNYDYWNREIGYERLKWAVVTKTGETDADGNVAESDIYGWIPYGTGCKREYVKKEGTDELLKTVWTWDNILKRFTKNAIVTGYANDYFYGATALENVQATQGDGATVVITADVNPGLAVAGMTYAYEVYRNGALLGEARADDGGKFTFTDSGVKNGEYDYFFYTKTDVADGAYWNITNPVSVTVETHLPAVTAIRENKSASDDTYSVTVEWDAPEVPAGVNLLGYNIFWDVMEITKNPSPDNLDVLLTEPTFTKSWSTFYELTGEDEDGNDVSLGSGYNTLDNEHTVYIQAVYDLGKVESEVFTVTLFNAPTNLREASNTALDHVYTVTVEWDAPEVAPGVEIEGYNVYWDNEEAVMVTEPTHTKVWEGENTAKEHSVYVEAVFKYFNKLACEPIEITLADNVSGIDGIYNNGVDVTVTDTEIAVDGATGIAVYSATGVLVAQTEDSVVNISTLAKGVYAAVIGDNAKVVKFVKD